MGSLNRHVSADRAVAALSQTISSGDFTHGTEFASDSGLLIRDCTCRAVIALTLTFIICVLPYIAVDTDRSTLVGVLAFIAIFAKCFAGVGLVLTGGAFKANSRSCGGVLPDGTVHTLRAPGAICVFARSAIETTLFTNLIVFLASWAIQTFW